MLEDKLLTEYPAAITSIKSDIDGYGKDVELLNAHQPAKRDEFSPMVIMGVTYAEKAKAGEALLDACKNLSLGGSTESTRSPNASVNEKRRSSVSGRPTGTEIKKSTSSKENAD